jgi:hypothetical protein
VPTVYGEEGEPLVDVRRLVESPAREAVLTAVVAFDPDAPHVELAGEDVACLR